MTQQIQIFKIIVAFILAGCMLNLCLAYSLEFSESIEVYEEVQNPVLNEDFSEFTVYIDWSLVPPASLLPKGFSRDLNNKVQIKHFKEVVSPPPDYRM